MDKEKYYWCTKCGAILNDYSCFNPNNPFCDCPNCGARMFDPKVYQGERFKGVFWHCKECEALLNIQEGFRDIYGNWKCTVCSSVNNLAKEEIDDFTKEFEIKNVYRGERFNGIFWHCDECGRLLNVQEGFRDLYDNWKCTECNYINHISEDEIVRKNNIKVNNSGDIPDEKEKWKADDFNQNQTSTFCFNCGHRVSNEDCFCENCGEKLR